MSSDHATRFACWFVGLVLLATGTGKVFDLGAFAGVVASYDLLSPRAAAIVAYTWPFTRDLLDAPAS